MFSQKKVKSTKTKGLVYSTDRGRTCPGCGHPVKQCCCSKENNRQQGDCEVHPAGHSFQYPPEGYIRVSRQTKGRKGSGVCLITGLDLGEAELKKLAKQLKKKCGSGGTVKNGVIEIQGNQRDILVEALTKLGFKAKLAGG